MSAKTMVVLMSALAWAGAASRGQVPAAGTNVQEPAAYLGVATAPVDDTLATQLGMPRGVGLVVNYVDPESKASGPLKAHDILRMFDDQVLINTEQLSILTRLRMPGESIKLKVMRQGQPVDVSVELISKDMPPIRRNAYGPFGSIGGFTMQPGGAGGRAMRIPGGNVVIQPAETSPEQMKAMQKSMREAMERAELGRAHAGQTIARVVTRSVTTTDGSNGTWTLTEGGKSYVLTTDAGGARTLTVTDAAGKQVFAGPVDTDEQRSAMPADMRKSFDELDSMANDMKVKIFGGGGVTTPGDAAK